MVGCLWANLFFDIVCGILRNKKDWIEEDSYGEEADLFLL